MKGDTVFCLVGNYAVTENLIMSRWILIYPATIAGVALDGVDNAVFDLLDDTDMIGLTVLRAGTALVVPIEEDNHAGRGLHGVIRPLPTLPEPLDTVDTAGELRNDTGVDIAAFVCTPADEAGAPLHRAAEAVPCPIGLSAHMLLSCASSSASCCF